jgi:hypothetical protein
VYNILVGKPEGVLGDVSIDGKIILMWFLKKLDEE